MTERTPRSGRALQVYRPVWLKPESAEKIQRLQANIDANCFSHTMATPLYSSLDGLRLNLSKVIRAANIRRNTDNASVEEAVDKLRAKFDTDVPTATGILCDVHGTGQSLTSFSDRTQRHILLGMTVEHPELVREAEIVRSVTNTPGASYKTIPVVTLGRTFASEGYGEAAMAAGEYIASYAGNIAMELGPVEYEIRG